MEIRQKKQEVQLALDEKAYQQEILGELRRRREEVLKLGKEFPRGEELEDI